jgi:hypothetical protein
VRGDIPIDNKTLLMTDFMNLKIKLAQSFRDDHMSRIYMCVFIEISTHIYMSIYIYTVFLYKKEKRKTEAKTSAGSVGNGFGSSVLDATHGKLTHRENQGTVTSSRKQIMCGALCYG